MDLGGKSLVGHLREIWETRAVQQKVDNLKNGVKSKLEHKLTEASDKAGKIALEEGTKARDELTDGDRAALFDVLKKAGVKP